MYTLYIMQIQWHATKTKLQTYPHACTAIYPHFPCWTQWFCQHGKSIGKKRSFLWLIMVVLKWCHSSTMAGFHCHHQHVWCISGKKKKSQIGEAGETEESNQDSLALFHRFWVHSHFCFFPFLASFPVPDNLHIIPHQLLHLFPSSRYFLLSVAWRRLGSVELDWIAQRSSADISHSPSHTLTSTLFSLPLHSKVSFLLCGLHSFALPQS